LLPGASVSQVLRPERERAALRGSHRIDGATLIVEDAFAVGLFNQADALIYFPKILFAEFLVLEAEKFGDAVNFRKRYPDKSRRACAAVAALCAFEFQAVFV